MSDIKILVVVHDAGAAEQISAMIAAEQSQYLWSVVAPEPSPARTIFKRKKLDHLLVSDSAQNPNNLFKKSKPKFLIAGTGTTGFEHAYVIKARQFGVKSVAWLDHWVNYRERFGFPDKDWNINLPDVIAVSDSCAFHMAENLNLGPLVKLHNYYFEELLSLFKSEMNSKIDDTTLLYISEAIEEHWTAENGGPPQLGYTQTEILESLLDDFDRFSECFGVNRIIIRMHPAESPNKYNHWLDKYSDVDIAIEIPNDRNLSASVASAKIVIGISSMALMIAHLLGKPTISYIPGQYKCDLPLPSECCLNDLNDLQNDINLYIRSLQAELTFFDEFGLDNLLEKMELVPCENCRHN